MNILTCRDQIENLKALLCEEGQIFWFILHFGEEDNVRKWCVDQYVAHIMLYRRETQGSCLLSIQIMFFGQVGKVHTLLHTVLNGLLLFMF